MTSLPRNATRRAVLKGVLATAAAGMCARAAQRPALAIPEVDSLTLQVLVDNITFGPFLPDQSLPGLRIERNTAVPAPQVPSRALVAEFGLSVLASSRRGDQLREVLVDFGYSPEVLAHNLAQLGIDTSSLDAAVLSHGHRDHYGGFAAVFSGKAPASPVSFVAGGEETFCERVGAVGSPPPSMGALDRVALAAAGFEVSIAPAPVLVADHAFTTGTIPLETFERAAIPSHMKPGVGCEISALSAAKQKATQLPDDGEHELATCYAVKGLGLVVVTSCGHRGVLNSVRRAQAVSGIDKIHAVVGGFHLVTPRTEGEARRTAAELEKIAPNYIVPLHCTGDVFTTEALRLMPGRVIRSYVGNRFTFGAG